MDSKKIRIGLLLDAKGISSVDLSHPERGNPGVGGTQYCFLLLAYYLNKFYESEYDIYIFSYEQLKLPNGIQSILIQDLNDLPRVTESIDIIIAKQSNDYQYYDILDDCSSSKIIIWAHNFLFGDIANRIAKSDRIKAVVFVSKQMYDFYVDHDIIKKSTPIFNIVPYIKTDEREIPEIPTITYMGQISKSKGIIDLLKIWKRVSQIYPEAQLNIIGAGNLYDRNVELGRHGISDEYTESLMKPYIEDEYGNIRKNIHFLGVLGEEKYDIFSKSTVGVVNPSASTETFGLGIVEMAHAYLPVVTRNWNGHPDTALHKKTALLGYTINQMTRYINSLIKNRRLNIEFGKNAKQCAERFSAINIIPLWDSLFQDIITEKYDRHIKRISRPYLNNYKFLREINAFFRHKISLKIIPSFVEMETIIYNLLKRRKN